MITYEDHDLRAVKNSDLDDFKVIFYIVCGVFGGVFIILIGLIIGLFVWVKKISSSPNQNNPAFNTRNFGRTLKPDEELAKRYTMSVDDGQSLYRNPTIDRNPLNKNPRLDTNPLDRNPTIDRNPLSNPASYRNPEPDILDNTKYKNTKSKSKPMKQPDKRSEPPSDGMHFVEDRLRDDLYY